MKIEIIKAFLTVKEGAILNTDNAHAKELIKRGLAKEVKDIVVTKENKTAYKRHTK